MQGIFFKACVSKFLFFYQMIALQKLFRLKSSFCSQDTQFFVIFFIQIQMDK